MAKFDLRSALVKAGKSGDAPQKFQLKDGKKTVGTFKLHGTQAKLAGSLAQVKKCVKAEDEIAGTIAGEKIVDGKLHSSSRSEFWDAEAFVEILDAHCKVEGEDKEKEAAPGAGRNGTLAEAPSGK